jgi:hypothetical protein
LYAPPFLAPSRIGRPLVLGQQRDQRDGERLSTAADADDREHHPCFSPWRSGHERLMGTHEPFPAGEGLDARVALDSRRVRQSASPLLAHHVYPYYALDV